MYRVMIIDDEQSARTVLREAINWRELNMEVIGEASSGIEAINTIDELLPDLCFVDINMPFMNGIEFTRIATERYPKLMVVVLTAYNDFDYARQCISLPVCEYILKPIVRSEITELLKKLLPRLEERAAGKVENASEIESSAIVQIEQYLAEHFTDSQLNLTSVAQLFGYSSSYLSRKFKQETGTSFIEYLTECRMKKAIAMANKREKMFVTADAVGIPDPNYFGRCFKKYTGRSYSEFINARQHGEQPSENE